MTRDKHGNHIWHSVWITGASSGIGAALAVELARPDTELVLSGRSAERLAEVASICRERGASPTVLAFNIEDPEERAHAVAALADKGIQPDLFVNNAGISQRSLAAETSSAVDRAIHEIDFLAGVDLAKACLPAMIANQRGWILTVSSVAALAPVPLRSAYNAAKAAQIAYFGTLGNELEGSGVSVTVAIPGFVRTQISRNALSAEGEATGVMDKNQAGGIAPQIAAARIIRATARGQRRVFTGMTARLRLMVALARFAPSTLDRILARAEVR